MAVNVPGLISIIICYLIILAVGIYAAWKQKKQRRRPLEGDSNNVILAGRNIGLFLGSFTMTATWVGGGYINGTAESIYTDGLVWAQAPWGYSLSLLLGGFFFAKKMRERNYITMLDPLQEKYGSIMGGFLYIPALLGDIFWSASILGALGATFSVVLQIDVDLGVIISALIALGYTLFGGLISVAYTDVVQLICIFIGLWITVPFAMKNEHVARISYTKKEWVGTWNTKMTGVWIDYGLHLIFGGIPWQVYFQRVLATKTPRYAQMLSFAASFGCFFMVIPAILLGAVASSTDWAQVVPMNLLATNTSTVKDTRFVLPMVLQYLTPTWVSFFGLGAISAAVMSSADSSILSASSMFSHNIYRTIIRPKASERELMWVIRISIVAAGALSTIMARTIPSVYALFVLCSDLVFVILFPQLLCAVYVPFVNVYGSIAGYVFSLFLRIGGGEKLIGIKPFVKYPYYDSETETQLFPYRTLSMVVNLAMLILVSYFVKFLFERQILSDKYDVFKGFYKEENANYKLTGTIEKKEKEIVEDKQGRQEGKTLDPEKMPLQDQQI